MAKLYFTYSAMNAGKSTVLLQTAHNYRERGMQVMLWTSHYHGEKDEACGQIESRIGLSAKAHLFRNDVDLYQAVASEVSKAPLHAILVDEAQFLTEAQVWQLSQIVDDLRIPVLCYGLRTDFQGELFEGASALLAISDTLNETKTICHCGRKATMTARVDEFGGAVHHGDQVSVDKTRYLSLCREHWKAYVGHSEKKEGAE